MGNKYPELFFPPIKISRQANCREIELIMKVITMQVISYLETNSNDPAYNLAFEEYILTNRRNGNYIILWQNDKTVVVGRNQIAEAEINSKFVDEHGIRVIRRSTGGGAVYHDLGNINYSFITDVGNAEDLTIDRFLQPIVDALKSMGLKAEASGRNDILVAGHKVSGTAQRIVRDRILNHGTLLFDTDSRMLSGALNVDPTKFESKSTKSVCSRTGNIKSFLNVNMNVHEFWALLKKELVGQGFSQINLTDEEIASILKLKSEKYDAWEWNFGKSPPYTMKNRHRFAGGLLEVYLQVESGRIHSIAFCGDFLSRKDPQEVVDQMLGKEYDRNTVNSVLHGFTLYDYFGNISCEEIMKTIFNYE